MPYSQGETIVYTNSESLLETCPGCGGKSLEFFGLDIQDYVSRNPWICQECGRTGEQMCSLRFEGHAVDVDSIPSREPLKHTLPITAAEFLVATGSTSAHLSAQEMMLEWNAHQQNGQMQIVRCHFCGEFAFWGGTTPTGYVVFECESATAGSQDCADTFCARCVPVNTQSEEAVLCPFCAAKEHGQVPDTLPFTSDEFSARFPKITEPLPVEKMVRMWNDSLSFTEALTKGVVRCKHCGVYVYDTIHDAHVEQEHAALAFPQAGSICSAAPSQMPAQSAPCSVPRSTRRSQHAGEFVSALPKPNSAVNCPTPHHCEDCGQPYCSRCQPLHDDGLHLCRDCRRPEMNPKEATE